MDTRAKILRVDDLPVLLAEGEWTVIAGLFDPMTAAQAQRIARHRQNGRKFLAVVLENEDALLSADARAALVAALRTVDAVVIGQPGDVPATNEDIAAERGRTAEFVQFVLDRSAPPPGAVS